MANANSRLGLILAGLLCCLPAAAQVTVGDNTNLTLSGNVSLGYSGAFGDNLNSTHGFNAGGQGQLGGYYYNPKFLSFHVQPYYNRSQNNSSFQSITNASGFLSDLQLFSGSRFPGAISYSKSMDGSGEFGIPGVTGFTTHGGAQTFAVTWSALLPRMPTLTANFSTGGSHSEVFGATSESNSHNRNFNLQSTYSLHGFRLNGTYMHQTIQGMFPGLLQVPDQKNDSSLNSYAVQTSHALPWTGQWYLGWNRSTFNSSFHNGTQIGSNDGTVSTVNSGVTLNPVRKLTTLATTTYTTNAFAGLQQQLIASGSTVSNLLPGIHSSFLVATGAAYYRLFSFMTLNSQVTHQQQFFQGGSVGATQYAGGANFNLSKPFLGSLTFSLNVVDTATEQGNSGTALVGNVNFGRRFGRWDTGAYFSYSQQIQTLLNVYTTSSYTYAANVRRRFVSGLQWTGNFHAGHSGFMRIAGSNNHTEGVSTSVTYGHIGGNGVWSRSGGVSVLTAQGLVPVPGGIPTNLVSDQILYNANSYGFGGSTNFKRIVITVNYAKSNSESVGNSKSLRFDNRLIYGRLQYRLRKLYLTAGVTNLQQSFTGTNGVPAQYASYYFGVSRWFNVF